MNIGAMFGEMSFLLSGGAAATLVAAQDSRVSYANSIIFIFYYSNVIFFS